MDKIRLLELLEKHDLEKCTPEEIQELDTWYNSLALDSKDLFTPGSDAANLFTRYKLAELKTRLKISPQPAIAELIETPVRKMNWKRWAVAATILFAIASIGYLVIPTKEGSQTLANTQHLGTDILPGTYKARLTLADGKTIILDSATLGELTRQGNTVVINKDGQLIYNDAHTPLITDHSPLYNTLTTASGETYATILSDGSKVWLNSGSSIKYPVAFTGNERKVEITGEAYFEIAKSITASGARQPFIVNANNKGEIEVLGTHFNVNAYDDESDLKVTLLEGRVRMSPAGGGLLSDANNNKRPGVDLKPGEQAVLTHNSQLITRNSIDLDQIMAWKNNLFIFDRDELPVIMRQLARWYNVEVVYEGQLPGYKFSGIISRQRNASAVLEMLKATENIHFRIEGKKIIVTQ
jgi:transmembrane sensor